MIRCISIITRNNLISRMGYAYPKKMYKIRNLRSQNVKISIKKTKTYQMTSQAAFLRKIRKGTTDFVNAGWRSF